MGTELVRRPWFQIHLSTAIVLMMLTGAIVGANTSARCVLYSTGGSEGNGGCTTNSYFRGRGWPLVCFLESVEPTIHEFEYCELLRRPEHPTYDFAVNALLSLTILVATACVCEWRIRRHARRTI